ncbi:MAG TPA: phosphatidate cytidylyltransferase [Gammaproteobacteria bacterium]|nr:phosphatidate cytidylyltransferase [Gammaproteobacteria bacterium]
MNRLLVLPSFNVLLAIAGVYALLCIATFISITLLYLKRTDGRIQLGLRIRTFWIIITVIALSFFLAPKIAIWFWAIISFLALKEYLTLIPTRRIDRRVLFWAYLAIPLQYYWVSSGWYEMFVIFIPVYVFLFLPLRMLILGETAGFIKAISTLHWGVMMMVYCMSYVAALYLLPANSTTSGNALGLIFYLLFLNQFNDAAQFLWGKLLGKHKIIPKVSPNKTVEGFIGGVLTTTVLAILLAPWLTPLDIQHAFFLGLIIGIGGFIGDITISALKRDLGIKDTGQLLPGHGGILDRLDSLIYTAPLYFHFIRYFYY